MFENEHIRLNRECEKRGLNFLAVCALTYAVRHCVIHKYRRAQKRTAPWFYDVYLPGYGKGPKTDKWLDVIKIGKEE